MSKCGKKLTLFIAIQTWDNREVASDGLQVQLNEIQKTAQIQPKFCTFHSYLVDTIHRN